MTRHTAICGLALMLLAFGCPARATVYGASGLILNPTADVGSKTSVSVGASTFSDVRKGAKRVQWASGTVGASLIGRVEVGLTYLHKSRVNHSGFGGFAKYQIMKGGLILPSVAVGIDDIGGALKTRQGYLVVSKSILPGWTGHPVSVTGGVIYVEDRDGVRRRSADVFGGGHIRLTSNVDLVAEWRSRTKHSLKNEYGAMVVFGPRQLNLALGVLNNGASDRPTLFIGVGFKVSTLD